MAGYEGINLRMFNAYIGACTFQRHWESIEKANADPNFVSHSTRSDKVRKPNGWTASLPDLVASEPWDVIVTQQSARGSGKPDAEGWQPYADKLIDYFKVHAPTAEIILQQTWSFPEPEAEKVGGQEKQFARIEENYRQLAEQRKLRVIPTGAAVQLARKDVNYRFATEEELDGMRYPELPPPTGDVAGGYKWINNRNTNHQNRLNWDKLHMNNRGEYLQACCWFGIIFQRDPATITYVPEGLDPDDARFLRACASRAIAEYKQAVEAPRK
jgi:hypothetical protein